MKNLQILLLLIAFIFCRVYFVAAEFDASIRWKDCVENPYLASKTVHVAYLSKTYVNQFHWKVPTVFFTPPEDSVVFVTSTEDYQTNNGYYGLPKDEPIAPHLLSICLCRNSVDEALFFMMPYPNSTGDDVIAVCVIGKENENFTSIGVFDDEELYDLLILKHQELIPTSVIDPMDTHQETCSDLYRRPAKNVMNQTTCLFAATVTSAARSLYSGPLMSKELVNFELYEILNYCFTTFNDTLHRTSFQDYCFIQNTFDESKLVCCCPNDNFNCLPSDGKSLYCLAGNIAENNQMERFPADIFSKKYFQPACTLTITAKYYTGLNGVELFLSYGSRACTCPKDAEISLKFKSREDFFGSFKENFDECSSTTINEPIQFCSKDIGSYDLVFSITYCCDNGNLCNYDLIPQDFNGKTKFTLDLIHCGRPALFEYLFPGCKLYRSLRDNTILNLFEGYNAKIYYETCQKWDAIVSFAIAKIIKADDSDCSNRVILEKDVFIPISICNNLEICPPKFFSIHSPLPKNYQRNFTCQNSTGQYNDKSDTWFCFIQINSEPSLSKINIAAGHLEIRELSECYFGNVFNESFCCINVFAEKQSDSNCTIEKLTKAYKEHVKVKNEINRIIYGEPTQCIRREFVDDRDCPGTDGCFDIRNLEAPSSSSTTTITDVTEVAGCLGYSEEYTLKDFPMASLSLHCRLNENANKCSIVHGPDGLQHVLCCCNQNGEYDNCRKQSDELSKQIGKHVSSFKEWDA